MCYMCCEKNCYIGDCENNVGGTCKYMEFAETPMCKPEKCSCTLEFRKSNNTKEV
jgi:hypothetical protein